MKRSSDTFELLESAQYCWQVAEVFARRASVAGGADRQALADSATDYRLAAAKLTHWAWEAAAGSSTSGGSE